MTTENEVKVNPPAAGNGAFVTKKSFITVIVVWTVLLCAATAFFTNSLVKASYNHNVEKFDHVKVEIDKLKHSNIPKIAIVDLAKTAKEWADEDANTAFKAIDMTIKFYTDKGYVVMDATNTIGKLGSYEVNVPTPQRMRDLMSQAEKQNSTKVK